MIGTALAFLLMPSGFIILGIGIALAFLMYWVIDPKLRTISSEYEKKQKDYLMKLDEIQKWAKMLINEHSHYFIARAENKKVVMELLINTKR